MSKCIIQIRYLYKNVRRSTKINKQKRKRDIFDTFCNRKK